MKKRPLLPPFSAIAVLISICVAASIVAGAQIKTESYEFHYARHDENTGEIRFDVFQPVAWEKLAHANIKTINIDHPTPEQVVQLREKIWEVSNSADVKFDAPLEPGMARGKYYLVSPLGVESLTPGRLEGAAGFTFTQDQKSIAGTTFTGEMIGAASHKASEGGFVLFADHALTYAHVPDARATLEGIGKATTLNYSDGATKVSLQLPDATQTKVEKAFAFIVEGKKFLFVKWPADTECNEGCCLFDYSLYSVGDKLVEITASSYQCDV